MRVQNNNSKCNKKILNYLENQKKLGKQLIILYINCFLFLALLGIVECLEN
jgi:hypothetical protein